MTDKIIAYPPHNVFTNDGQSDVDGFAVKLAKVAAQILAAGPITVYYGFHGDTDGKWDRPFDPGELAKSLQIALKFPDANMVKVDRHDDSKIDYAEHDKNGGAVFTWCDSEKYIRDHKLLPSIVK